MKTNIRYPAVAGLFYPSNADELSRVVQHYIKTAKEHESYGVPKAIIAPHAGYIYSGPVAGTAYHGLEVVSGVIKRVVLVGPSHRVAFRGVAASSAEWFATPLGDVPLDTTLIDELVAKRMVQRFDQAHTQEHSLEVHLPFLQAILGDFSVIPLVVGEASADEISEILTQVWGGPETLIVVSSDLSHYHSYADCQALDAQTTKAIEKLAPEKIAYEQACGRLPINGLLSYARDHQLTVRTLDVRNSGDTAGPKDRVVGYGAYWVQ